MKNENTQTSDNENVTFIQTLVKKSKESKVTSDVVLEMLEEKIK